MIYKKTPGILSGLVFLVFFSLPVLAGFSTKDYPIFFEAEGAKETVGFRVVGLPRALGCSGEKNLNLWQPAQGPGDEGYFARYTFSSPVKGKYWITVWAQSLEGEVSSPFWLVFDGKKTHCTKETVKIPVGSLSYGSDGIVPHILGPVELARGRHSLTLRVNERRAYKDKAYNLIVDAIGFTPVDPTVDSPKKPAGITIDPAQDLGEFVPMTDMSQGGIGEVADPEFWKSAAPLLKKIGIRQIRLDHIFDYYGIVGRDPRGKLEFHWEKFDAVMAQILACGAKPFFSVSYLPTVLIRTGTIYEPPKSFEEWKTLCAELARHMKDRWKLTGLDYEIWNEPDIGFWKGTQAEYFQLYRVSGQGILAVDPSAKLGGPASAMSGWIEAFLRFVKQEKLKLDFVSWHYYNCTLDPRVYAEQIGVVKNILGKLGFPPTVRTIYSEWNINGNVVPANDSFYAAANAAATLAVLHRTNTGSFFFMPKDPKGPRELHGWFGAITFANRPKPVYNFFDAYSRLKGQSVRVTTDDETIGAFAALDQTGGKNDLRILVWNFDGSSNFGARRKINLTVPLKNGTYKKAVYVIDREHSNLAVNPARPGLEQIEAGEQTVTGQAAWTFELENGGVWFMELSSGK